jgi:hypothetical protein
MGRARWLSFCIAALVAAAPPAWSQTAQPPRLPVIWEAYRQLDFATARQRAEAAIEQYETYSLDELVQVYTVLGLIAFAEDRLPEARRQFTAALSLNPALTLDPLLVSPKILRFFEEVRAEWRQARREGTLEPAPPRYIVVEDPRPAAALRSMMAPGWGQLYLGKETKGRVLMGAWGVAAAGAVASSIICQQRRADYREEGIPLDEEARRYDAYNQWYKIRNNTLLGVAGLWLYGIVDALTSENAFRPFRVMPGGAPAGAALSVQVRF